MKLETKTIHAQLKQADDQGRFEAVIATLGVVDSDGDIVEPGAFGDATASIMPSHDHGSVPLGKVKIEERGDEVIAAGRFYLEIQAAREWHAAIKNDLDDPPSVQEWSWGYFVKESRDDIVDGETIRRLISLDLEEVSPVLRAASVGTRTLVAKSATARHKSATTEAPWDGPANERRLPSPVPIAVARQAYAWIDESAVDEDTIPKSAARFIHHVIGADGLVGAASTRAAITGIAVLNGARGGTTIPSGERSGVHRHLAGHLKDADLEPPELRSESEEPGMKLSDQVRLVIWDAEAAIERLREVSTGREKRDQHLSDETRATALEMATVLEDMGALSRKVAALAKHCSPEDHVSQALAAWERSKVRAALGA